MTNSDDPKPLSQPPTCEACGAIACAHLYEALGGDSIADRVGSLRAWARSRIEECRRQEEKFGGGMVLRVKHQHGPPQSLVEAWTERRALQAVLRMLDGEETPT